MEHKLLLSLILLPLFGAFTLVFCRAADEKCIRTWSLIISMATFLLSLLLLIKFDHRITDFQFEQNILWIESYNIHFHLGIDGISIFFVLLTTLLTPICVLVSWSSIKTRIREYFIAFLLLEAFIIGIFSALDFVLFYLFFEAMLIPMFLIIGVWGGENRIYAAFKFFLFTMAGSVLLLIAIIYIYNKTGSFDIALTLPREVPAFAQDVQKLLWLAFFIAFAVKVPMWPVHTWLPDAHVQAPTAGSVILAGILLKIGGYGFVRLSLPLLPFASKYFADFVFVLSYIAVIYASLVALVQKDMKKLIAYSSIAHMGFVTIGIFTFSQRGIEGALVQMISHGIVSAALFMCVGVLYDRMHTKEISKFGGVADTMPNYAAVFMLFALAAVGLPGTSGFIGEFLVLIAAYKVSKLVAALAATGVILGAAYMLWLYKRVIFGVPASSKVKTLPDLNIIEIMMFIPLVILVLVVGIYPKCVTDILNGSVMGLIRQVNIIN